MTTETETTDLTAQHLAFKEKAVEAAHKYASEAGHCSTFDQVLHELGLPGRSSYYATPCGDGCCPGSAPPELAGEETAEEFNAWRLKTARRLYAEAVRHGIYNVDSAMTEAGFPSREEIDALVKRVPVKIAGQFTLTTDVEAIDGVNLIEFVSEADVLRLVRNEFKTDAVTWKVTVADTADAD